MPGLTFPKNPNDGQTASWSFTDSNQVAITRTWTFDAGASSWVATPSNLVGGGGGGGIGPQGPTGPSIFFSVKDFGAVGDGSNDDTNAILSAVDASIDYGGGIVYFPPGTYKVTERMVLSATGPTSPSLHLWGEGGSSKIIVDPSSQYINRLFWIYGKYPVLGSAPEFEWSQVHINGLEIDANNRAGIAIDVFNYNTSYPTQNVTIENCIIRNTYAVLPEDLVTYPNGYTTSGIRLEYAKNAKIQNCVVENVTRGGYTGACQAIVVQDCENALIQNNYIKNVDHGFRDPLPPGAFDVPPAYLIIDADGIVVFSTRYPDATYERQQVSILGNTIIDCAGRFIKLQTNGQCLVEGNLCKMESNLLLNIDWKGVDSQVANAHINNNTFYIGSGWTGGRSATMFRLASPRDSTGLTSYDDQEGFYTNIENNFVESEKTMSYFLQCGVPAILEGKSPRVFHTIKNNVANFLGPRWPTNQTSKAFARALWVGYDPNIGEGAGAGASAGEWFLDFHGNNINTQDIFVYSWNKGEDFTSKHFIKLYDNMFPTGATHGTLFTINGSVEGLTLPYTSTCMIRDNQIGLSGHNNYVPWPIDPAKMMSGSDWQSKDQTIPNAPAGTEYSRFSRQGNIWEIQTGQTVYYSSDGINWNSCCNTFASISGNSQASGAARWDYTAYNANFNGSGWDISSPSVTAYNLLEIQNSGTTAYGISVTGDQGLTLSGFTGFAIMPVPNGTIVKLSYRGGKYFFSAPNPIDGVC